MKKALDRTVPPKFAIYSLYGDSQNRATSDKNCHTQSKSGTPNTKRYKTPHQSQEQERAKLPKDSRTKEPQHKAEPFSFTGEQSIQGQSKQGQEGQASRAGEKCKAQNNRRNRQNSLNRAISEYYSIKKLAFYSKRYYNNHDSIILRTLKNIHRQHVLNKYLQESFHNVYYRT